jgi:hypothetical protein
MLQKGFWVKQHFVATYEKLLITKFGSTSNFTEKRNWQVKKQCLA